MDFDLTRDINIFNSLFQKRPELFRDSLKTDLQRYYLPYCQKLIELKKIKDPNHGLIVGVSAIQGAGKTTQGEIMEILLDHFGHSTHSRSIDDHYITHQELCQLRSRDPRFIRRGVTHDIPLAILDLRDLKEMTVQPVLVSGYNKGAHHGDGDRFRWINPQSGLELTATIVNETLTVDKQPQAMPALQLKSAKFNGAELNLPPRMGSDLPLVEHLWTSQLLSFLQQQTDLTITCEHDNVQFSGNGSITVTKKDLPNGWRLITKKPDFIFYDGWMLGARRVEDESVFTANLPALETEQSRQFAKDVNQKLDNYQPLWDMIEFMNVLYVPNYQMSLQWRDQAEETLRAKGEGMTHDQIAEFVHYFWRSVHPAIHLKNLAEDPRQSDQVVIINDDHSIAEVRRST